MLDNLPSTKRGILLSALTGLAILFSLFSAEVALRYLFVPVSALSRYSLPGVMGAKFDLDQADYHVAYQYNHDGFRGPEFPKNKPAGVKRLLVLGDSFGEGFGVPIEERFSNLLLDRLNAAGPQRWDLVNGSQAATNPDAYFDNLIRFGVAFKPDLVVIAFFLGNDFMDERFHPCPGQYTVQEHLPNRRSFDSGLFKLGYLRKLIRQAFTRQPLLCRPHVEKDFWSFYYRAKIDKEFYLKTLQTSEADFNAACKEIAPSFVEESLHGRINPAFLLEAASHGLRKNGKPSNVPEYMYNEADFENTYALLAESAKVLQARRIPYLILIIPDVYTAYPKEYGQFLRGLGFETLPARLTALAEMQGRLMRRFDAAGIQYLDLTAALRACPEFPYYLRDHHFNRNGHAVAAAELYTALQGSGVVRPPHQE